MLTDLGSFIELNGSRLLSFSKTQPSFVLIFKQFHNCVTALTSTAVSFLSFNSNSKTATAFSLKTFLAKKILSVSQSFLGKALHSLNFSV